MTWNVQRIWTFLQPMKRQGFPDETLLSVYRDYGVIPKDSRDDNHNRAGMDLSVYQLVEPGDVVMNKMKAWQGSIAVSRYRGIVSPDYMVLRVVREEICPAFLHFLLRSGHMITEYRRHAYGVRPSQWRLMYPEFRDLEVGLPPYAIQRAIAGFLDRKTAAIDALIEKKERLLELLGEKRAALIHRAVTKGLDPSVPMKDSGVPWIGQIPVHWELVQLRRVLSGIEQGWSPQCEARHANPDEWGVLKAGCTAGGRYREAEHKALPATEEPKPPLLVKAGDIIVSRASGSPEIVGSAALVTRTTKRLMLSDKLFRLRTVTRLVDPAHLVLALGARSSRIQIENSISGAQGLANNLPQSRLREVLLPLPPVPEQRAIAERMSRWMRQYRGAADLLEGSTARLREYRQALITAAVTGQLDIEAAEHQPIPDTGEQLGLFGGAP